MRYIYKSFVSIAAVVLVGLLCACDDGKSYSDMLRDEEGAVNWYLAQNRVETRVPADSVFEEGADAPFYRMNSDGTVYMRVIRKGDMKNRPAKGDRVYFRFMRYSIGDMYDNNTLNISGVGNSEDLDVASSGMNFVYGNTTLTSTTRFGTGIQVPCNYLGYDCEVDLIVKSIDGFTDDISQCVPYLYKNMKYFKAEY